MKITFLSVGALALGLCAPLLAQTDAGTPSLAPSAPLNRPIPQKLILPSSGGQTGVVTVNKDAYQPGQEVAISFTVANPTKKDVPYDFLTGQKFDMTVLDSKGTTLWQWSQNKKFTQGLSRLTLAPGRKLTYHAVWNGRDANGKPVPPGLYMINARLTSTSGTVITGGVLVNPDTDPTNLGVTTNTPADTGAVRQVNVMSPVSASKQIAIGVAPPVATDKK
jgi:hypothetical protein